MTVFGDAPGSVTQLLPAASVAIGSPSGATLALNHSRASRHTGPQARRCAPSGVDVRAASSRRSAITRCGFIGLNQACQDGRTDYTCALRQGGGTSTGTALGRASSALTFDFCREWIVADVFA